MDTRIGERIEAGHVQVAGLQLAVLQQKRLHASRGLGDGGVDAAAELLFDGGVEGEAEEGKHEGHHGGVDEGETEADRSEQGVTPSARSQPHG